MLILISNTKKFIQDYNSHPQKKQRYPILKSQRLQKKVDPIGKSTQREEITLQLSTLSGKNRTQREEITLQLSTLSGKNHTQSTRYQTHADDPLWIKSHAKYVKHLLVTTLSFYEWVEGRPFPPNYLNVSIYQFRNIK